MHDVHPTTFYNWGAGRWAFFIAKWENPKIGLFGEVHFVKSRIREDTVAHELDHARTEYMYANGFTITRQNEERMAIFLDNLVGGFYRQYNKRIKKVK
jgi:hypothetical protein